MLKKLISLILALSMIMASFIMPSIAFAADTPSIDAQVSELLSRGKYVEHSAIALVKKTVSTSQPKLKSANSVDLVKTSKNIMSVSSDVFEEMSGESQQPEQTNQAQNSVQNGPMLLSANNASLDDYEIVLVQNNSMSTAQILKNLLSDSRVAFAEPNYIKNVDGVKKSASIKASLDAESVTVENEQPAGPEVTSPDAIDLSDYQWVDNNYGYGQASTWRSGNNKNSEDVVVAVIDTGIDYEHPDLDDVMYHISPEAQAALSCGEFGIDVCNKDSNPKDDHGHGTHCAGSIAAEWNNEGVNGVANGAKLVAVKVMSGDGRGTTADIIEGFNFVASLADYVPGLRVINYSIGSEVAEKSYVAACRAVADKGIVICKSAGNESYNIDGNYSDSTRLAAFDNTIVVNAMDRFYNKAGFSNYGYRTNLYAPGVGIVSTYPTDLQSSFHIAECDDQCLFKIDEIDGLTAGAIKEPKTSVILTTKDIELSTSPAVMRVYSFDLEYKDAAGNDMPLPENTYVMVAFLDKNSQYHGYIFNSLNSRIGISFGEGEFANNYYCNYNSETKKYEVKLGVCLFNLAGENVYLDEGCTLSVKNISGGVKAAPYETMDGTSMATPFTAGCTAVMCQSLMDAGTIKKTDATSGDAITLANYVKAHIKTLEGKDLCSQYGNVDLTINESNYTPVINSVEQDSSRITLNGQFFGRQPGSVDFYLNENASAEDVEISEWKDDEIIFTLPHTFEGAGLATITVNKTNGKKCTAIESVALEENNLFEKLCDISELLSKEGADYVNAKLAAVGGNIYISAKNCNNDNYDLFVYNPKTDIMTDTGVCLGTVGDIENIGGKLWTLGSPNSNLALTKYSSLINSTSYTFYDYSIWQLVNLVQGCTTFYFDLLNVKDKPMLLVTLVYEDHSDAVLIELDIIANKCSIGRIDSLTSRVPGAEHITLPTTATDLKTKETVISFGIGYPMLVLLGNNRYELIPEDVWQGLPTEDTYAEFALAMNNNKIYITALNYLDTPQLTNDCDTYVLDLNSKNLIFEPYGNKASQSAALCPAACFMGDNLYVFYNTNYDSLDGKASMAVMRVDKVDKRTYQEKVEDEIEEFVQSQVETINKASNVVKTIIQNRIERAQKVTDTIRSIIKGIFSW